jgi:nicotinamide riboside transporter PnuC
MVRGARYAYAALAWAFVAGILLQVFFIGLGLFVKPQNFDLHVNFGWLLHLGPLPILVAAALARAGRTRILQATSLAVIFFIVPILAAIRADSPWAAAFHPVGALLGFWLATIVARGATSLLRSTDPEARTTRSEWLLVVLVVLIILFLSFSGSPDA